MKRITYITTIEEELKIAIQASLEVGKVIMEIYSQDFSIDLKEDKSVLTEADREANDIINTHLIDEKAKKRIVV